MIGAPRHPLKVGCQLRLERRQRQEAGDFVFIFHSEQSKVSRLKGACQSIGLRIDRDFRCADPHHPVLISTGVIGVLVIPQEGSSNRGVGAVHRRRLLMLCQ